MTNAFSPSLTLAGMDYIAPSSVCVKPAAIQPSSGLVQRHGVALQGGETPSLSLPPSAVPPQRVEVMKISLRDCLACSGCVTTAETVLVASQSREELLAAVLGPHRGAKRGEGEGEGEGLPLSPPPRSLLVTVSDASAASLAAFMGTSLVDAMSCIAGFFKHVARSDPTQKLYVSDLRWALRISAELTAAEYIRRCEEDQACLPLIVSACPGWVCYCEKQGGALLSLLSPFLSPQGIAGSLAKRCIDDDCYHVSIQPCFDKKLEAARDGGYWRSGLPKGADADEEKEKVPYTDCVLSTAELLEWMREVDEALPWRAPLDSDYTSYWEDLSSSPSSSQTKHASLRGGGQGGVLNNANETLAHIEGSGGYLRRAMEKAMCRMRAKDVGAGGGKCALSSSTSTFHYETKRNRNHQLVRCAELPQETFCVAYGFQQIQNIVRGLKKKLPAVRQYTFIEMMACPDGCLNGGGQIRQSPYTPQNHEATLQSVEGVFEKFLVNQGCVAANCMANGKGSGGNPEGALLHSRRLAENGTSECTSEDLNTLSRKRDGVNVSTLTAGMDVGSTEAPEDKPLFSQARVADMLKRVGPDAVRCVFTDRQKDFEDMLNKGNVQSLKW